MELKRNYTITKPSHFDKKAETDYYIVETAKMIKRSNAQTFGMTKGWPLEKIRSMYLESVKNASPSVHWWALRKKDILVS